MLRVHLICELFFKGIATPEHWRILGRLMQLVRSTTASAALRKRVDKFADMLDEIKARNKKHKTPVWFQIEKKERAMFGEFMRIAAVVIELADKALYEDIWQKVHENESAWVTTGRAIDLAGLSEITEKNPKAWQTYEDDFV